MKYLVLAGFFLALLPSFAFSTPEEELLNRSIEVLYELSKSVDRDILSPLFEKAWGIAVFPGVERASLFVGVTKGEGVIFARSDDRRTLFGPAFYTLRGVNLGVQAGIQSQDVILFIMRKVTQEALNQGHFVLGGNLSVALGPTGRGFSAAVDPELSSPCYAYALSRGIFVGASFEGTRFSENIKANERFWGRKVKATTILSQFLPPDFVSRNLARFLETLSQSGEKR